MKLPNVVNQIDLKTETKGFVLNDLIPAVAVSLAALIAVQILASLNSAGGIVRLLLLIVSAVQWIIEKGKCLIALVQRIGSAVGLLASGDWGGLGGIVFDVLGATKKRGHSTCPRPNSGRIDYRIKAVWILAC